MAERITALPGASAVYRGGVVSYTNDVKAQVLGVPVRDEEPFLILVGEQDGDGEALLARLKK